jgi:PAS domain S-box-containing protein
MIERALIADVGRRSPALLFTTDARGHLEYVNERWTELLGVPAADLLAGHWTSFVHPDDMEHLAREFAHSLQSGKPYRGEFRLRHADGAYRWIEARAEPERDHQAEIVRWFGAGNDVDAQHRAMDALQLLAESGATANSGLDAKAMLEGVARAALAGLADIAFFDIIEPDGEPRRFGVGSAGVTDEALETTMAFPMRVGEPHPISRSLTDLHSVHVARVDEAFITTAIADPARQAAWRSVGIRSIIVAPMIVGNRRLGALTMLRTLSGLPFEASDVRVVEEVARRAAVAVENIRLTEAARRTSTETGERFRLIADSMPMLMWTTHADGSAEWFNRRWHEYTGIAETSDVAGRQPVHHNDLPAFRSALDEAIRSGSEFEGEHRLRRHDGTFRWFLSRAIPERDESGAIVRWYGTDTDIDDVRRAQRTLHVFAELGAVLAASLEVQATLDVVMHVVVPEFADWAFINLVDENGDLRVAAIYHRDEAKRALLETQRGKFYSHADAETGTARVVRTGEPVLYESVKHADITGVAAGDVLDVFEQVGLSSAIVTPLMAGNVTRGTLSMAMFESARTFRDTDVAFCQELARRIAPAIANAELFERERRVARTFQNAALPASLPATPACAFSAIYEAGSSEALVGGDWYDAFVLADGRVVLSIGDVAGSGLQAAVTMANMRQAIRGVAYVHPDPVLMLEAADLALRSESPDRFVTAFVAVIDPIENMLTFTTAGHPPPLLRTPAGEIVELEASGLPLGLREHDGSAGSSRAIEPGSILVLYSDGLIESTHDLDEGYRRLHRALADAQATASAHLAAHVRDAVLVEGARDDVAILSAHYAGVDVVRHAVDVRDANASAAFAAVLVAALAEHGYAPDAIVNAEIVLSEIVGNLVRHAPGPATFVIDAQHGRVVLHVLDAGPGYRFLSRLPTDTLSERGRGLFLISALAEAFHVTMRPGGGSHARVTFSPASADAAARRRWSRV